MVETIKWRGMKIPATLPGVEFDPGPHEYRVLGKRWPNVTGFLDYSEYAKNPESAAWGTSAHAHAFHLVKGTIDMARVKDNMRPTLEGFQAGLKHFGVDLKEDALAEYIVYSRKFHFIGRFDFMFAIKFIDLLLDLKTGTPDEQSSRRTGLQLGGYAHGVVEHGFTAPARLRLAELNVQPDGTWTPREFNVREVMHTFLAKVTYDNYRNKI